MNFIRTDAEMMYRWLERRNEKKTDPLQGYESNSHFILRSATDFSLYFLIISQPVNVSSEITWKQGNASLNDSWKCL